MFSYLHAFHAGNHADVFKHIVLIALLEALKRKENPFFVLDTHAGEGLYDLYSPKARRLREFETGIARLWGQIGLHPMIDAWLTAVEMENPVGRLCWYPGSPCLIARQLRDLDSFLAVEGHPQTQIALVRNLKPWRRTSIVRGDGYHALRAHLPPCTGRGLVFIDPSYENQDEFSQIRQGLHLIHQRFRQGIVAIWYPLLPHKPIRSWLDEIAHSGIPDILISELSIDEPDTKHGLYGGGMLIVNPPWRLEENLGTLLPILHRYLAVQNSGYWRLEKLVDERGTRLGLDLR